MAKSNRERIAAAFELLGPELAKYVEQELRDVYADKWMTHLAEGHVLPDGSPKLDTQRSVSTMLKTWDKVFDVMLDKTVKDAVYAVKDWRNKHAHEEPFTFNETTNALIDMLKLLEAIQ